MPHNKQTKPGRLFLPIALTALSLSIAAPFTYSSTQRNVAEKKAAASKAIIDPDNNRPGSQQDKKRQLLLMIDAILANAPRIKPAEYSILTQVEAAALLWQFDKQKAASILSNAVKALNELGGEDESKTANRVDNRNRKRLRFQVLRKIAALNTDLLKNMRPASSSADKPEEAISREWTEEGRALISVAYDQIAKDPKLAAQLAEQTISLGYVSWQSFLQTLVQHDSNESERLAIVLIDRLRDSLISSVELRNLRYFIFSPGRSSILHEHFFKSLVIKLRRDSAPDTSMDELTANLNVAQEMSELAAGSYARWQAEFENIIYSIEAIFSARSLPQPGSPQRVMLAVPLPMPSSPGDTREMAGAIAKVETIADLIARDKEYQRLAAQAALNADLMLAEDIMSKIKNQNILQETTLMVYGPAVRRTLAESSWTQAQKYALSISDPMARTVVLDRIARAMSQAKEEKFIVKGVYDTAWARLVRDEPTDKVAKALLFLAKAYLPIDAEASIGAASSAVSTLNKVIKEEPLQEPETGTELGTWVSLPNLALNADEVLNLTDMMGAVFMEITRHKPDDTFIIANGLVNTGLSSLARLAIIKTQLDAAGKSLDDDRKKISKAKSR